MDAATRDELAVLRLRAYGPAPDIHDDDAALSRLVELEAVVLETRAPRRDGHTDAEALAGFRVETRGSGVPIAVLGADESSAAPAEGRVEGAQHVVVEAAAKPARRARWPIALVGGVAAITLPLGIAAGIRAATTSSGETEAAIAVAAANGFVLDPSSRMLIQVRIDGSFGNYVELPTVMDVPVFPASEPMVWVQPLGEYYGWDLWIGGGGAGDGGENCLLLADGTSTRSQCVPRSLKAQGALFVTIPYARIAPIERPEGMNPGQSVGFWWGPDSAITIMVGTT